MNNDFYFQFFDGAINNDLILQHVNQCNANSRIGGVNIFFGQVRNDVINDEMVEYIEFTANNALANSIVNEIFIKAKKKFTLEYVSIIHSLGSVSVGEICMLICVGAKSRGDAYACNSWIVEKIKKNMPIWGKEYTSHNTAWKINN